MPTFEQREQDFQTLERGTPRLNAMRDAIHDADRQGTLSWQFWFRYDYIRESVFCGDRYYALIMFPELLQLYDDHPELQEDPNISWSMLVTFKWIMEATEEFPQISRQEIDRYFRLYRQRLQEQGYSLSSYYMKRSMIYLHIDKNIAARDFFRFLEEPLDSMSDGKALCYNYRVEFYLSLGEEENAIEAARPIFERRLKAYCLPHSTQHKFCRYYLYRGEYDKAAEYARQFERRVDGDPFDLHQIGTLVSLYSVTDPEHAVQIFNRNFPLCNDSKNPWMQMHFLIGAVHLFDALAKKGLSAQAVQVPKDSPAYPAVCENDLTGLSAHFYRTAKALTDQFDKRNGTDCYLRRLRHFRDQQET